MKWSIAFLLTLFLFDTNKLNAIPIPVSPLDQWCNEVQKSISKLKWSIEACSGIHWQAGGSSFQGRPLVYAEFGDLNSPNTTLIFSTVHGDEVTPLYLGIELAHWLKAHQEELGKTHVVVAPLINPDGFFKTPRTRMNARGVDVNRNFATRDWPTRALAAWKIHGSNPRRFPGNRPASEPETKFQEELIKKVRPQKILSIHSPLNFLDYDGPTSSVSLAQFPKEYAKECERLKIRLKAMSKGFFPGSLGNYAGRELGIPTLTLELPSADPRKAKKYWKEFSQGIQTMIQFSVPIVPIYEIGQTERSQERLRP